MKEKSMSLRVLSGLFVSAGLMLFQSAAAQTAGSYPDRTVRIIVSYAAGNITDVLARTLSQRMAEEWRQPVVIENRPGQGGSLGAQNLLKLSADGYTLLFSAMAALAINPHIYPSIGFDALRDFQPIIGVAYPNGVLYANATLPANTLPELVALSRSKPGSLNYGSAGSGTVPHLNVEALKVRTGLDATHVPYKAAVAVLSDVAGGSLQFAQESVGVVLPQIRSGRIKPLVVLGPERIDSLPGVPAVHEVLPGFVAVTPWLGLFARRGTPPEVIARVESTVSGLLKEKAIRDKIEGAGMVVLDLRSTAFSERVAADYERLGKLVKTLDLKAD
jgi:tripartite-type tricarboxylate transporter receptor subunit TctC